MPSVQSDFTNRIKKMLPDIGFANNYSSQNDVNICSNNLYKQQITIDFTGKTARNLVMIKFNHIALYDLQQSAWNFNDLRVFDTDGVTPLSFFVQNPADELTLIFVKFTGPVSGIKNIFFEYGNPALENFSDKSIFSALHGNSCRFHFSANVINLPMGTNTNIWQWQNQAKNNHANVNQNSSIIYQSMPTLQTNQINGLPILRFDSSQNNAYKCLRDESFSTEFQAFIVAKATSLQNYQSIIRLQDIDSEYLVMPWGANATCILSNDGGSGVGLALNPNLNQFNILSVNWKKNIVNGFQAYKNLVLQNQRNASNTDIVNTTLKIGFKESSNTEFFNGDLAEIIILNTSTSADRTQLNQYLDTKYQIVNSSDWPVITIGPQNNLSNFQFNYTSFAPFSEFSTDSKLENDFYGIATTQSNAEVNTILQKTLAIGMQIENWTVQSGTFFYDLSGNYSYNRYSIRTNASTTQNNIALNIIKNHNSINRNDLSRFNQNNITESTIYVSEDIDFINFDFFCENVSLLNQINTRVYFRDLANTRSAIGALTLNQNSLKNGLNKVKIKKSDFSLSNWTNWQAMQVLGFQTQTTSGSQIVAFSNFSLSKNYEDDEEFKPKYPVILKSCVSSDNDVSYYKQTLINGRIKHKYISDENIKLEIQDYLDLILSKKFKDLPAYPNNQICFNYIKNYDSNFTARQIFTFNLKQIFNFILPNVFVDIDADLLDGYDTTDIIGNIGSSALNWIRILVIHPEDTVYEILEKWLKPIFGSVYYNQLSNKITVRNGYKTLCTNQTLFTLSSQFEIEDRFIYDFKTETGSQEDVINTIKIKKFFADGIFSNSNTSLYRFDNQEYFECKANAITTLIFDINQNLKETDKFLPISAPRIISYNFYNAPNLPAIQNDNSGVFFQEITLTKEKIIVKIKNGPVTKWLGAINVWADFVWSRPDFISYPYSNSFFSNNTIGDFKEFNLTLQSSVKKYGLKELLIDDLSWSVTRNDLTPNPTLKYARLYDEVLKQLSEPRNLYKLEIQYLPEIGINTVVNFKNQTGKKIIGFITSVEHNINQDNYTSSIIVRELKF